MAKHDAVAYSCGIKLLKVLSTNLKHSGCRCHHAESTCARCHQHSNHCPLGADTSSASGPRETAAQMGNMHATSDCNRGVLHITVSHHCAGCTVAGAGHNPVVERRDVQTLCKSPGSTIIASMCGSTCMSTSLLVASDTGLHFTIGIEAIN